VLAAVLVYKIISMMEKNDLKIWGFEDEMI
jgi:hypothetical protein